VKRFGTVVTVVACTTVLAAFPLSGQSASLANGHYSTLRFYEGKWDLTWDGQKEVTHIENHCAQTGRFFVCEQSINGKTAALIVFLPIATLPSGGEEYRTQGLDVDASPAGEWGKLTIEGNRWVYTSESMVGGKKVLWRNTNTFAGTDKIRLEIERSDDGGGTWKVQRSGDEQRM
jgi:hypothetical protein